MSERLVLIILRFPKLFVKLYLSSSPLTLFILVVFCELCNCNCCEKETGELIDLFNLPLRIYSNLTDPFAGRQIFIRCV